uniref:Transcription repressor n=1 Tax=Aegilops tauschii TaxID=37682 RepID=M8AU88_AEGTA
MGKKLALASLFFAGGSVDSAATGSLSPPYSPPPTTRVITNPAYCDDDTADSSFVSATASSSASTAAPEPEEPSVEEAVIRGIRASSRLFFEPEATKSIVTTSKPAFGGATALAIDSADPYGDFRRSMEEMVLSRGGGGSGEDDWGWLEEMLGWYLRANGKKTHGLIVGAFVDLLVGLSAVNNKQSGRC